METDFQALNEQFGLPGQVTFQRGPGELAAAVVNNRHAAGAMTLAGGQVMTFTPHDEKPLLWISPNASYSPGHAIRGGVPVCWPWFAAQNVDPQHLPMHGLVRTMVWKVSGTRALADGSTEVRMEVTDTAETRALWPHAFRLEVTATFGQRLNVAWDANNTGETPFDYTGALHAYYAVSDVETIQILGLDGIDYLDKVDSFRRKTQSGPLRIHSHTDRIYLDTSAPLMIEDSGLQRTIHVTKEGSRTSVVWNPYEMDVQSADIGAGQHAFFVCVEAANAGEEVVHLEPGQAGRLALGNWAEGWAQP